MSEEITEDDPKITEEDPKLIINRFVSDMCGPRSHLKDQAVAIKILCAIPVVGAYEDEISKFIGYAGPKDQQVRRLFRNAIKIGIIEPCEDNKFYFRVKWMDENMEKDKKSISIILDSMCITGEAKRTKTDDDDYIYEMVKTRNMAVAEGCASHVPGKLL